MCYTVVFDAAEFADDPEDVTELVALTLTLMLGDDVVVSDCCKAKPSKVPTDKNRGNRAKNIGVKSTVIRAFCAAGVVVI